MNRFAITFSVFAALAASATLCTGQQTAPNSSETGNSILAANSLLLLSANILQPKYPSDSVMIYRISGAGNLVPFITVLEAQGGGPLRPLEDSLTSVYSVHDIGPYLMVDYPHMYPRNVIFVPKNAPGSLRKILFDSKDLIVNMLNHDFSETSDGAICDLWPVFSQPSVPDGRGA